MNGQAGKGSDPRPVDKKKYRENFDKIDWSKKPTVSINGVKLGTVSKLFIRIDTANGKDVTTLTEITKVNGEIKCQVKQNFHRT